MSGAAYWSPSNTWLMSVPVRVGAADHPNLWAGLGQRYRTTDPDTSKAAAQAAKGKLAQWQREQILATLKAYPDGLTGREVATIAGIDYHSIQRRISEVQGIHRNGEKRDGGAVWKAA